MTPNRISLLILLPEHQNILIAAGFQAMVLNSSSAVGEVLGDLTTWRKQARSLTL